MMSDSTSRLLVSFGGHTLGVVSDSPQISTAIQTHLRHCPVQEDDLLVQFNVTASAESRFTVSADGSDVFSNLGYDFTLQNLMTELISRLVSVCERGLVIHAAALAQNGNAVILSAQGGSGKSTLAAWLAADGLQYLTDEVIEFRAERSRSVIHTLPRSIFLKRGSAFVWKNRLPKIDSPRFLRFADDAAWIDPELFNPITPASQATPRLLIFPRYIADAPLQTQKLTTAETLFRILENATNARNLPRHGMDAATALAQRVTAYNLTYSNLEEASEWIRKTIQ